MNRISETVKAKIKSKYLASTVSAVQKQVPKCQTSSFDARTKSATSGSAIKKYYNQVEDLRSKSGSKIGSGVFSKSRVETSDTKSRNLQQSKSSFMLHNTTEVFASKSSRQKSARGEPTLHQSASFQTLSYMNQTKASILKSNQASRKFGTAKKSSDMGTSQPSSRFREQGSFKSTGRPGRKILNTDQKQIS